MEVKLNDVTVKIKDALTWGDKERIKNAMNSGAKVSGTNKDDITMLYDASGILEAKYVLLECAVVEIIKADGAKQNFTRDWMDNLTPEDGDKLYDAVDKLKLKKNG